MRVASLHTYPVKGCRGVTHTAQALTRTGLAWDRHWMFVSETGRFITQRECPGLARIDAEVAAGELRLRSQGHPELRCPVQADGPRREVTVDSWSARSPAMSARVPRSSPVRITHPCASRMPTHYW